MHTHLIVFQEVTLSLSNSCTLRHESIPDYQVEVSAAELPTISNQSEPVVRSSEVKKLSGKKKKKKSMRNEETTNEMHQQLRVSSNPQKRDVNVYGLWWLILTIENKVLPFIVDTGSCVTIITNPPKLPLQQSLVRVTAAEGHPINVTGKCVLKC
jgi:hypothetical protein